MLALIGLHSFLRFSVGNDTGCEGVVHSEAIGGEVSLREVTATFVREVDHINYLTIEDENGNEQVIATTDSHPFWVVTDEPDLERAARGTVDENGVILYHENIDPGLHGFWVEAKDLREGDIVLGANGELSTLVSQERVEFEESITVYNFTVDGNHNYFVIAAEDVYGQTCVLVHNAGYGDEPGPFDGPFTLLHPNSQPKPPLPSPGKPNPVEELSDAALTSLHNWYKVRSSHPNNFVPDLLKILGINLTHVPETGPWQPQQGVSKPTGMEILKWQGGSLSVDGGVGVETGPGFLPDRAVPKNVKGVLGILHSW